MHWLSTFSIVAIAAGSSALGAQAAVRLTTPDAVLSDAFSFVRGVRELANGQLLVADWVEQRVVLVDLAAGSTRDVITEGIAIIQHPGNCWYPAKWFTRDYGFFSPTPMYWLENDRLQLPKDQPVTLKYRVIVHGEMDNDTRWLFSWKP